MSSFPVVLLLVKNDYINRCSELRKYVPKIPERQMLWLFLTKEVFSVFLVMLMAVGIGAKYRKELMPLVGAVLIVLILMAIVKGWKSVRKTHFVSPKDMLSISLYNDKALYRVLLLKNIIYFWKEILGYIILFTVIFLWQNNLIKFLLLCILLISILTLLFISSNILSGGIVYNTIRKAKQKWKFAIHMFFSVIHFMVGYYAVAFVLPYFKLIKTEISVELLFNAKSCEKLASAIKQVFGIQIQSLIQFIEFLSQSLLSHYEVGLIVLSVCFLGALLYYRKGFRICARLMTQEISHSHFVRYYFTKIERLATKLGANLYLIKNEIENFYQIKGIMARKFVKLILIENEIFIYFGIFIGLSDYLRSASVSILCIQTFIVMSVFNQVSSWTLEFPHLFCVADGKKALLLHKLSPSATSGLFAAKTAFLMSLLVCPTIIIFILSVILAICTGTQAFVAYYAGLVCFSWWISVLIYQYGMPYKWLLNCDSVEMLYCNEDYVLGDQFFLVPQKIILFPVLITCCIQGVNNSVINNYSALFGFLYFTIASILVAVSANKVRQKGIKCVDSSLY